MTEPAGRIRLTAWLHGSVQGVGFRWWTRSRALELGLEGWAKNLPDGRVEVVVEGPAEACRRLTALLAVEEPAGADGGGRARPGRVTRTTCREEPARGVAPGFREL